MQDMLIFSQDTISVSKLQNIINNSKITRKISFFRQKIPLFCVQTKVRAKTVLFHPINNLYKVQRVTALLKLSPCINFEFGENLYPSRPLLLCRGSIFKGLIFGCLIFRGSYIWDFMFSRLKLLEHSSYPYLIIDGEKSVDMTSHKKAYDFKPLNKEGIITDFSLQKKT